MNKSHGELNISCTNILYSKIKATTGLFNEKVIDHKRNAMEMEKEILKLPKGKDNMEFLSSLFEEIIRVDPYYGKVLKEIKRGYDCIKENKEKETQIQKTGNEILKKGNTNQTQKNNNLVQEDVKSVPRKKPVKIPKLDLSRIKNKYEGEKIVVTQPHSLVKKSHIDLTLNGYDISNGHADMQSKFKN